MILSEYLKSRGVPAYLAFMTTENLAKENHDKYRKWKNIVGKDAPITIITGPKCKEKEIMATCMMSLFHRSGMSMYMCFASTFTDAPASFLYIVLNAELLSEFDTIKARTFMMEHLHKNKPIIIECESLAALESKYGRQFMDYLASHGIVEVDITFNRPDHMII